MLKKNIRERKEYLYKKNEEIKQKLIHSKKNKSRKPEESKNKYKKASGLGSNIFKLEKENILNELNFEDDNKFIQKNLIDDEYQDNRNLDPKILLTTSRDPSQRLQQFLKEMRLVIPNAVRVNRGNYVIKELIETCKENEFSDLIILHENKGNPDGMIISHLPYGPSLYLGLFNVVLRHDIKEDINTMSETYPHLIFDGFKSEIGNRISEIMKNIFPIPKPDSQRVLSFVNKDDFISFRHHTFTKGKNVDLEEIGPRFELRPYQVLLGTLDMPDTNREWVLRPYINTFKKNNNL
jgi:U3 small nucleolar ribonucleoprotein protein IMP4